ncbi:MAG: Cytochrome c-type biogenesis protein CcmH [Alphaproteobacteria bacterium MarineAlpha5_Bin11]|nr:hypothetical protein [Pelagibacteraceae bacterium]PPR44650.1 MAG: Cytochrome c-type biogenesis protein CcmH [Alphaproteobacteria bacterium MarineAlpha5_Bin11]PPR51200.1 MAG: Cytochrome c-type biogenesis protein CcmH [Alphaproteobacteria bacterium MarineAlpha5_Bin10]|tara:strand:+ start:277 stop:669 length:393 start_codon:yes stop_codon:yes gene_type:complete
MNKKLKNYYLIKKIFISASFIILISSSHTLENNLAEITKELRCMTCQNQTIYESESDFSNQIKNEIMRQLKEGKSKKQIIDFLSYRYGEYILFRPQFDKKNLFLWLFPFVLISAAFVILFVRITKNRRHT